MFEFHGWVVLHTTSGKQYVDERGLHDPELEQLIEELELQLAGLHRWTRPGVHLVTGTFQPMLSLSGFRNHCDPSITGLFEWLTIHAARSYGYLWTRDVEDVVPYDPRTQFRSFRLGGGAFVELDSRLEIIPQSDAPPMEDRFSNPGDSSR